MEYELLKDIAKITMGQSPSSSSYNENGDGLPFFQGNADFGEVYPTVRIWCNNVKKVAHKDDILVSVRAPIGAVNMANHDCCIGRGLAAITVNKPEDREYIFRLLKAQNKKLNQMGTGSTFKAIGKKVLENIQVPILSKNEKIRAMQILKRIESLVGARKSQLFQLDAFVKARFVEMFGDPVKNTKKFGLIKLSDLGLLERGKSKHRPRNDPALLGGPYPLIQTGEVTNSGVYIKDYSSTYSDLGLAQSHMWPKGTLCITIAANIAQTAILNFDACFPDSVVGFIPNDNSISTIYLHYWFTFFQKILDAQAPQVAQKNINLKILSNLKVIVPPLLLQQEFASFVHQVDKSKVVVKKISKFHNISQEMCVND